MKVDVLPSLILSPLELPPLVCIPLRSLAGRPDELLPPPVLQLLFRYLFLDFEIMLRDSFIIFLELVEWLVSLLPRAWFLLLLWLAMLFRGPIVPESFLLLMS